MFVLLTMV
ncbi:hypothetical protein CIB84_016289 [Bambusicola thoracicus]|uniref:Uncharacterized protein n=1 Tax=Bambusicola thoracicus TaxID=9083 RepID=A0A2P4S769_BAMTH|nr:hypothetical protein CIB84_016289 [Bambusicola thoracicus]